MKGLAQTFTLPSRFFRPALASPLFIPPLLIALLALAALLTSPGPGAVQAQGGPPGAQASEATAQSSVSLTVSDINDAKATLNLSGHATAWYYKADKTPDNTCKGPVTAGTTAKTLTGARRQHVLYLLGLQQ